MHLVVANFESLDSNFRKFLTKQLVSTPTLDPRVREDDEPFTED